VASSKRNNYLGLNIVKNMELKSIVGMTIILIGMLVLPFNVIPIEFIGIAEAVFIAGAAIMLSFGFYLGMARNYGGAKLKANVRTYKIGMVDMGYIFIAGISLGLYIFLFMR